MKDQLCTQTERIHRKQCTSVLDMTLKTEASAFDKSDSGQCWKRVGGFSGYFVKTLFIT